MQAALKAGLPDDEIKKLLKLATSAEIKEKLKRSTQEALDYGVNCSFVLTICTHLTHLGFFSDHTAKLLEFLSVQLGTGSNVSKQHISTCRYIKTIQINIKAIPPAPMPPMFRMMIAIGIKLFLKGVLLETIVLSRLP